MKHIYTLLICIIATSTASAQLIPIMDYGAIDTIPCPYAPTTYISTFPEWEIYQTINNEPDGIVDSSLCLNIYKFPPGFAAFAYINPQEIDLTRSLFFRLKNTNIPLLGNSSYFISTLVSGSFSQVNDQDTCSYGHCSGLWIGVTVTDPDTSNGIGQVTRWHQQGRSQQLCMATEPPALNNILTDLFFRITFIDTTVTDPQTVPKVYISNNYTDQISILDSANAFEIYRTNDDTLFKFDEYYSPYILAHADSLLTTDTNMHYIELAPSDSLLSTTQQNMTIDLEGYTTLLTQPFTELRGALISGDTVNRHTVSIVNNGADVCFTGWFEKGFEDGAFYEHRSGQINFQGERSCMFFGRGARLIVDEGASMQYGYGGRGMLALFTGGTIEIRKNATLLVGGTIIMNEYGYDLEAQQIYMELNKGSELVFLEGSHITNRKSLDGTMKLNIYMNGGKIDLRGLPQSELKLINLIYPEAERELESNITYGPNPVENILDLTIVSNGVTTYQIEVFDLSGRSVQKHDVMSVKGYNRIPLSMEQLQAGTYLLNITSGKETVTKKIIKR